MTTALIAKNKLEFVNGILLRPDNDDLLFQAWIRCNSMVVSWIRNSISPQICSSIMYLENARDIWLDLRDRFSVCDSAHIYQLRQKIMTLSQGPDDINTYFTNLRIVWDEYKNTQPVSWCVCTTCRCRSSTKWHNHQEEECVMQFLIGLNSSYSQIRSHILSMVPLPTLSKVFSLVLQEERQRSIEGSNVYFAPPSSSEQPYAANAASSSYNRSRVLTVERQTTLLINVLLIMDFHQDLGKENFVDDCCADLVDKPTTPQSGAAPAMPTFDQCQQLIALLQSQIAISPSTSPSAALNNPPPSQSPPFTGTTLHLPFIANLSIPPTVWLLDTCATHHVCCNLSLFTSSFPVHNASVNLPNGATASITHIWTVCLTPTIILQSVLYVPSFSFNLISVSSLTSSLSCTIIFTHDSLVIQEASQATVIGRGNRMGNLYTLDVKPEPELCRGSSAVISNSIYVPFSSPSANSVVNIDV